MQKCLPLQYQIKTTITMTTTQKIKSLGDFNGWRGFIGLYLTTKEIRPLKKYGITKDTTIKGAFDILNNI